MTLPVQIPTTSYIGNNSANNFPFTFYVFTEDELTVVVTSPDGNTNYDLVLGTDFSVSALNPAGGPPTSGSITLINASQIWLTSGNLTTDYVITISRVLALSQSTSIRNQGDFYPETIENSFDYITMLIQQLEQAITPTIQNPAQVTGDLSFITVGAGTVYQVLNPSTNGYEYWRFRLAYMDGVLQPIMEQVIPS